MTEGRREPPSERPSEPPTGPAPARTAHRELPSEPPSERPSEEGYVGPLLVERHRKADGRPLILYWEARVDGEAAGAAEAPVDG